MTLDEYHNIHMPLRTSLPTVHDIGGGEITVHNAVDLEASDHVSGRPMIGIDHADQIGAWARLADHAQTDQSIQHDAAGATR